MTLDLQSLFYRRNLGATDTSPEIKLSVRTLGIIKKLNLSDPPNTLFILKGTVKKIDAKLESIFKSGKHHRLLSFVFKAFAVSCFASMVLLSVTTTPFTVYVFLTTFSVTVLTEFFFKRIGAALKQDFTDLEILVTRLDMSETIEWATNLRSKLLQGPILSPEEYELLYKEVATPIREEYNKYVLLKDKLDEYNKSSKK